MPPSNEERREALKDLYHQARACTRCPQLASTRTTVVFGSGNANADLMFCGEAPGKNEDEQGLPFVGQAGKLLDKLLAEIGLTRADVFVVNVLKCRPPGNRTPTAEEAAACAPFLDRQIDLVALQMVLHYAEDPAAAIGEATAGSFVMPRYVPPLDTTE